MFARKFIHHIPARGWPMLLVSLFVVIFSTQSVTSAWANYTEWQSDDRDWFTYVSVEPLKTELPAGEVPRFVTDAVILQKGSIRWEDTLKCRQDGAIEKYPTQYWPEGFDSNGKRATEGSIPTADRVQITEAGEVESWGYFTKAISPKATECIMCGIIYFNTPLGYQKIDTYCLESWFKVNQ